ncbi:hypothetical protein MBLNU13_g05212t2 [Cladosporium sp. NU13]
MYIDHLIERADTFIRKKIVASKEDVTYIRNACDQLEIELSEDVEMDADLGDPTDATVLHSTIRLPRLPSGNIDDYAFLIGYLPRSDDYVDSKTLRHEDDRSSINAFRARIFEPRVVANTFLPVAPGDSDDSDLEDQAKMRQVLRAQSAPAAQRRHAQEQDRRNRERQKRGVVPRRREGVLRSSGLGRILEETDDEEDDGKEDVNGDNESQSEVEAEDDHDEDFIAVVDQEDPESKHQFNLADLLQDEEETVIYGCDNRPANNITNDSGNDQIEVVDNESHQIRALSISDANDTPRRLSAQSAAQQAKYIKEDRNILPALKAMLLLPLAKRIKVSGFAFPKIKDYELNKFNFRPYAEIEGVWHFHRNHPKMFDLDDAIKSPDSPMSPSFVSSLRMFHRFVLQHNFYGKAYNSPPHFGAIPPAEDTYKCGGSLVRMAVPDTNTVEEVMVYNDAFRSDCAFSQPEAPTGDPEYNLRACPSSTPGI